MSEKPYILAVSNRKGGSGKTTTTVNLAAEWAAAGFRVLVIDLDPQNHAVLGLGGQTQIKEVGAHLIFNVEQVGPAQAEQLLLARRKLAEGLDLIPAQAEFDSSHVGSNPRRLHQVLSAGTFAHYDLILLDTPPSIDAVLMNALVAAQGVVVPLLAHHLAAHGVRELSRLFVRASVLGGEHTRLLGLLPIMVDRRVRMQKSVLAGLAEEFGERRIMRGIRSDVRLAEAFAAGQSVREFSPRSRGAMDYHLASTWLIRELGLVPAESELKDPRRVAGVV